MNIVKTIGLIPGDEMRLSLWLAHGDNERLEAILDEIAPQLYALNVALNAAKLKHGRK